jgi:hypothetical protein
VIQNGKFRDCFCHCIRDGLDFNIIILLLYLLIVKERSIKFFQNLFRGQASNEMCFL